MFPPNQTPGAQVTGNDDDFSQFIRQAVADEMAKTGGASQQQNPGASPIPVTINGQTVSFNSPTELSSALQQTLSQYTQEIERLKTAQVAPPPPPVPQRGAEVTGQDEPSFDMKSFVDKFTTNPMEALDYADQYRFGVKNPSAAIKQALADKDKVAQMEQAFSVYQFKAKHPEFVETEHNARVIQQVIGQHNLTTDFNGLEAAYALAMMKGAIQQHPQQQQNQQWQGQQGQQQDPYANQFQPQGFQNQFQQPQFNQFNQGRPQQNPNFAPPRVGRQSPAPADDMYAMAETMTPEQIEGIFQRFQS